MAKRLYLHTVGRLLLVSAALASCAPTGGEAPIVFEVKRGSLEFSRSFYGEILARKSIAIHTPELSGVYQLTVESVLDDGAIVKKDDVVLKFATGLLADELQDQEAQLQLAKAEKARLEQTLARERIDLSLTVQRAKLAVERARLNVISGVNLVSKVELQKAKIELDQAKLVLLMSQKTLRTFAKKRKTSLEVQKLKEASIEDKVKQKRVQMAAARVLAPASGVLYAPYTRLNWVRGKVAPGSVTRPGDKILEIPDLSAFDVALFVRQRDASLLELGDKAAIYPTVIPDQKIEGKVVKKESFASTRNERLGTRESAGNLKEVRVLLRLEKSFDALRPGGTVRADVKSIIAKDVLTLPLVALKETPKGYTAEFESGATKSVKIGKVTATHVEIVSGLSQGDRVRLPAAVVAPPTKAGKTKAKTKRRRRGKRPRRGGSPGNRSR